MSRNTRDNLLDAATGLVRRRGYSAFSYADLSEAVGIRKASIHHHFPSKEDLGEALVAAYMERFSDKLDLILEATSDPVERLDRYAELYREGLVRKEGCLCGVLASEIGVLPVRVQAGVRRFFALNLTWLEQMLEEGASSGLRHSIQPRRDARTVLSVLQGAMFVALSTQDPNTFDEAVSGLVDGLRSPTRKRSASGGRHSN